MQTSNKACRDLVESRIPFTANNLFAEIQNDVYTVYSYGYLFPIYAFANGKWYASKEKYSRSTTKHQNQARPRICAFIYLTTDELQRLKYGH